MPSGWITRHNWVAKLHWDAWACFPNWDPAQEAIRSKLVFTLLPVHGDKVSCFLRTKKYIHRGPGTWSSRMKVWCVTPRLFSHMIKPLTILELAAMLTLLRSYRLMITIHISWYACSSALHFLVIRKNQKWFMDIPGVNCVPCIHQKTQHKNGIIFVD